VLVVEDTLVEVMVEEIMVEEGVDDATALVTFGQSAWSRLMASVRR
jgi:hypothetical protein